MIASYGAPPAKWTYHNKVKERQRLYLLWHFLQPFFAMYDKHLIYFAEQTISWNILLQPTRTAAAMHRIAWTWKDEKLYSIPNGSTQATNLASIHMLEECVWTRSIPCSSFVIDFDRLISTMCCELFIWFILHYLISFFECELGRVWTCASCFSSTQTRSVTFRLVGEYNILVCAAHQVCYLVSSFFWRDLHISPLISSHATHSSMIYTRHLLRVCWVVVAPFMNSLICW